MSDRGGSNVPLEDPQPRLGHCWYAQGLCSGAGTQVAFGWRLERAEAFPGFSWVRI